MFKSIVLLIIVGVYIWYRPQIMEKLELHDQRPIFDRQATRPPENERMQVKDFDRLVKEDSRQASIIELMADAPKGKAVSVEQLEKQFKDPDGYRKFLADHQAPTERTEADKLLNFFARGKYE